MAEKKLFNTKERVCLTCEEKFHGPNYQCPSKAPGENHDVEKQQYYSEFGGLTVLWRKDLTRIEDGKTVSVPSGPPASFVSGTFYTNDPEEQDHFEFKWQGGITKEQWIEKFTPPKVLDQMKKEELAYAKREAATANAELEKLKAQLAKAK